MSAEQLKQTYLLILTGQKNSLEIVAIFHTG